MPQSNRIILTDVDGVLLEWEHHFTKWMVQRTYFDKKGSRYHPYRLLEDKENTYEMAERFGVTIPEIRKEIREFNRSAWMGTQRPIPDSQTWVKLLHAEGWTFIPITSQTSDKPAQELRKKRLGELFGEQVFSNYHILGTGADKGSALAEFHNTGLYWVEDKPKNALAGLNYGLKVLLYDHPYNQDFNHPEITRVNNWKQIHEILVK
jgi:beta-phosphoglucomutase-like phosphatase (HAD superfamily)|tara:strand:+ start:372 stop:992 length:621 start_codon:yes stop_codon:yes gene_type:complete